MSIEEFERIIPGKTKVRIIKTKSEHLVKALVYNESPPSGYIILLDNDRCFSMEYLEFIE